MAQELGWPEDIGWRDLLQLSREGTNPETPISVSVFSLGWASKGHAEWRTFLMGHGHLNVRSVVLLQLHPCHVVVFAI